MQIVKLLSSSGFSHRRLLLLQAEHKFCFSRNYYLAYVATLFGSQFLKTFVAVNISGDFTKFVSMRELLFRRRYCACGLANLPTKVKSGSRLWISSYSWIANNTANMLCKLNVTAS